VCLGRGPSELHEQVQSKRIDLFFFQAEDGIRDYKVTGVQTCALPISDGSAAASCATIFLCPAGLAVYAFGPPIIHWAHGHTERRSEERRVGKECTPTRGSAPSPAAAPWATGATALTPTHRKSGV